MYRMIERREELRFLLEAPQAVRITRQRPGWQNFQRDVATELRVAGAIDFAHPASAENSQDFVRPEACAQWQRHVGVFFGSIHNLSPVRRAGCARGSSLGL